MTEDEAKTRWCPFARVDNTASNRGTSAGFREGFDPCCIGSACMAWRWRVVPGAREQMREDPKSASGVTVDRWSEAGDGYCGLAGQP